MQSAEDGRRLVHLQDKYFVIELSTLESIAQLFSLLGINSLDGELTLANPNSEASKKS
jgi:hypothetical protein